MGNASSQFASRMGDKQMQLPRFGSGRQGEKEENQSVSGMVWCVASLVSITNALGARAAGAQLAQPLLGSGEPRRKSAGLTGGLGRDAKSTLAGSTGTLREKCIFGSGGKRRRSRLDKVRASGDSIGCDRPWCASQNMKDQGARRHKFSVAA